MGRKVTHQDGRRLEAGEAWVRVRIGEMEWVNTHGRPQKDRYLVVDAGNPGAGVYPPGEWFTLEHRPAK